ncbi:MAG: hypothetical protein Q9166_004490 [cf. Caloplaca sp. 2 TL-2023]
MDSEDGPTFVKNLTQFVRTHEKALANALQSRQQSSKPGQNVLQTTDVSSHAPVAPLSTNTTSAVSSALAAALTLTSRNVKSAKLTLTPHHLFYLLSRFEDIGVPVGPMNVRTENLHTEASPANYVSFLSQSQRSHGRSDRDSIHSVSSVRSVMSGMSAFWSGFTSSNGVARSEKAEAQLMLDLKYLYSAFTKIPCLRLSSDQKARLIRDHEEFPFDTAVPLLVFKNLTALEICDVDFRQFFGWDKLAEQLRSLTLKRANIDDPGDLITSIVLDDMEKRRRRSSKTQSLPVLAWPLNPPVRLTDAIRASCASDSPVSEDRLGQRKSPHTEHSPATRNQSSSPNRPTSSRQNNPVRHARSNSKKFKRSGSGSSDSSVQSNPLSGGAYRTGSSGNVLLAGLLPSFKWRFLRHLSLADNGLTSISVSSFAPLADSLHSLDLSSNLFTEIPDGLSSLIALRALNLSNCMIGSLQSLLRYPLPAITALNLRGNRLGSIVGVEKLLSLDRLDLRENRLGDPTELARLTELPELREVWVAHNPFTRSHHDYRVAIFNLFRSTPGPINDIHIDASGPNYHERKHLLDRKAEGEPVSVMKIMPQEPQIQPPTVNSSQGDTSSPSLTNAAFNSRGKPLSEMVRDQQYSNTDMAHSNHEAARSRRTAKGTRRQRLVDLAAEKDMTPKMRPALLQSGSSAQEPKSPSTSTTATVSAAKSDVGDATASGTKSTHQPAALPVQAPTEAKSGTMHVRASSKDKDQPLAVPNSQNLKIEAQAYRQKIEALKQEVGGNWLAALNEERWVQEKRADVDKADMSAIRAAGPGLPLTPARSSGVT